MVTVLVGSWQPGHRNPVWDERGPRPFPASSLMVLATCETRHLPPGRVSVKAHGGGGWCPGQGGRVTYSWQTSGACRVKETGRRTSSRLEEVQVVRVIIVDPSFSWIPRFPKPPRPPPHPGAQRWHIPLRSSKSTPSFLFPHPPPYLGSLSFI